MEITMSAKAVPVWFWAMSGVGLAWNTYGVMQYLSAVQATPERLIAGGMTAEQAAIMTGYPGWMTMAFAVGVFGGLVGCLLLLMRRGTALPVFGLSLAGYVALYFGDIIHGVFAAMGMAQVIVLSVVVLIAAGLFWTARHAKTSGILA
jgi:hypothetical protein